MRRPRFADRAEDLATRCDAEARWYRERGYHRAADRIAALAAEALDYLAFERAAQARRDPDSRSEAA